MKDATKTNTPELDIVSIQIPPQLWDTKVPKPETPYGTLYKTTPASTKEKLSD